MNQQLLSTPEDLFRYQLRSALTMEHHSLEALGDLHDAATDQKVKKLFSHHAGETREQIEKIGKVFKALGVEESSAPSPATNGIKDQASSLLGRAGPKLQSQIAVASALGNEHFEIATYDGLILSANALGLSDASSLLTENLNQEVRTSEELRDLLKDLLS